jgi:sterol 3beta-glucosyltransferase
MLKATDMAHLSVKKVGEISSRTDIQIPFLYNFSSAVVPKPLDWHDDM